MTGPRDGPQGMNARRVIERVRSRHESELPPVGPVEGEIILGAIPLEIQTGGTRNLRRLS